MKEKRTVRFLVQSAVIAALYIILSLPALNISDSFRFGEALVILPYFTPAAIPGLTIGCFLTNLVNANPLDIVFGTLATFLSTFVSYKIRKYKWAVPMPAVIFNGLIVGTVLYFIYGQALPIWIYWGQVGLSELLSCYLLGMPLLLAMERIPVFKKIFNIPQVKR